ncbi:skin secretory protein xP2-like [Panicum virgatum]|uniref:skin secretory protein xP2-like n=1 Tax=Panicum virgatum TaxID=38727 RepID=UPI0019D5E4E3|nr:skin secretory protein xP2-like [Panicum virgatum]
MEGGGGSGIGGRRRPCLPTIPARPQAPAHASPPASRRRSTRPGPALAAAPMPAQNRPSVPSPSAAAGAGSPPPASSPPPPAAESAEKKPKREENGAEANGNANGERAVVTDSGAKAAAAASEASESEDADAVNQGHPRAARGAAAAAHGGPSREAHGAAGGRPGRGGRTPWREEETGVETSAGAAQPGRRRGPGHRPSGAAQRVLLSDAEQHLLSRQLVYPRSQAASVIQ